MGCRFRCLRCYADNASRPSGVDFAAGYFSSLLGVVGAIAGEALIKSDKQVLKSLLADNQIKVDQLFIKQLKHGLENEKVFPQVNVGGDANARLNIVISNYGLFKKSTFDGDLRAAIWANVSLVTNDGVIVWRKSVQPEASEDRLPAHPLTYYQQHPEALQQSFEKLTEILVAELVADIKR